MEYGSVINIFREKLVPPARLERTTPRLGIWCSIHLSYGGTIALCNIIRANVK